VNLDIQWIEAERLAPIELSLLRKLMAKAPPNTINLALGELGFDFPEVLAAKAIELLRGGQPRYSPNAGIAELRHRIAYDYSAKAENVCVCNGAEESLYIALQALLNPGDKLAIPDPDYPAYPVLAQLAGAQIVRLPFDRDFSTIPWDTWKAKLQGVKAVLMSSPSNPSGYCLNEVDAQQLSILLNDKGIVLIVDEIYRELYFQKPMQVDNSMFDRLIRIGGLSKSHLMSGWRIGWIVAAKTMIESATKLKQYVSTCPAWLSQHLALFALDRNEIPQKVRQKILQNIELIKEAFSTEKMHIPQASPYVLIHSNHPKKQVETWLQKGVLTSPGIAYGVVSAAWIRINHAVEKESLKQALRIIQ